MITLLTGLPGNGKTLYLIDYLQGFAAKNPGRPVYYSGIRELRLPWTNIGGYIKDETTGETREVIPDDAPVRGGAEWHKLPSGAIVVIDECQNYFRVRGHGQPVPECVKELETHRHRGFDLFFITQHPMIIDSHVRRLCERHWHFVRWFGLQRATMHEFQGVKEQVDKSRAGSVRHEYKYNKKVYGLYKSAEVHTVKSRVPARVWFMIAVPFLLAALGYGLYASFGRYISDDATKLRIQKQGGQIGKDGAKGGSGSGVVGVASKQAKVTTDEYIADRRPRVLDLPHSAPVYDSVTVPVRAPMPAACVSSASRCVCFTEQATVIMTSDALCREIVAKGYYQEWDNKPLVPVGVAPVQPSGNQADNHSAVPAAVAPVAVVSRPAEPVQKSAPRGAMAFPRQP